MKFLVFFLLLSFSHLSFAADPEKGYDYLVNGGYIGCGIPIDVLKRVEPFLNAVPQSLSGWFNPLFQAPLFKKSEIPGRTGTNANLSHEFNAFVTRRGNEVANFNCLSCHSQRIGNQVIVGLGNSLRDFTYDIRFLLAEIRPFYRTSKEREEGAFFERSLSAISPYIQMHTVGVNPAINLTFALMAHRVPETLAWSDSFLMDPPSKEVPPVHVPPWWRMRKRKTMFYSGEIAGEHRRIMMLASSLCADSVDQVEEMDEAFKDVESYIHSLPPPPYPHSVDSALASRGKGLFLKNCASCHGTYGPNGVYSEKLIPIEIVKTDPALMIQETSKDHDRFIDWGRRSIYYTQETTFHPNQGYIAPALDGIWATAPYLHNGSVPNLEGVLNSSVRPKYWKRSFDSQDYDTIQLGWKYQSVSLWDVFDFLPFEKRFVYDTTLAGYSNQGHDFGDTLSQDERLSVIEYLKLL